MFKLNKPALITLTGPSASGKTYLHDELLRRELAVKVRSFTTRQRRAGEVDGVDYDFLSVPEALQMAEEGKLIEHNIFLGNHYGVTAKEFNTRILSNGLPPVVILDPHGVSAFEQVCRTFNVDIIKVYVFAPQSHIIDRLNDRYTIDRLCAIHHDNAVALEAAEVAHQHRLKNMIDERYWIHSNTWDAIVDGTDAEKSIDMIDRAITWRNRRNEQPTPFNGI